MSDICVRCGDIGEDRRTLWMACLYAMEEMKLPFDIIEMKPQTMYTLLVCKNCRAAWMKAIKAWFDAGNVLEASPGSGIYVRRFGANVEISDDEWKQLYPDREPVRWRKKDDK